MDDHVEPESPREADRSESRSAHTSDRPPTSEEAAAAERNGADEDDRKDVAQHEEEMMEIGANIKGEGEIA
jgi:hypothetical protein